MRFPKVVKVRQDFPRPRVGDVGEALREQCAKSEIKSRIEPGSEVAITAGSRGISGIDDILRSLVEILKEAGAAPFLVLAMGSHGGATAEGQVEILRSLGVTEESVGAPIRSSMEVVEIGETGTPLTVYMDRIASQADGVVVVGRIKQHTDFRSDIESGLLKMASIGLGKHAQALALHAHGVKGIRDYMVETGESVFASGKVLFGVGVAGNTSGNIIKGNLIGTTADGTGDLGNNSTGITFFGPDNTVGGTEAGAGNVVSGNGGAGVLINGSSATGNSVLFNSIFENDGLGIDLHNDGVTANDMDDPDTGENNLQNFPTINSATRSSTTGFTTINGTLNSNPDEDFLIQCFLTEAGGDPADHGEGATLLDTTSRSTGPAGNTTFQCDSRDVELGQEITATATNVSTGDTSEFSENEEVIGAITLP